MIANEIQEVLRIYKYVFLGIDTQIKKPRYRGEYTYQGNTFVHDLFFEEGQDNFLNIPKVELIELPDSIPERMPHFEAENRLCYLDAEEVFLNPFDLKSSTVLVLEQIQRTLRNTIDRTSGEHAEEHAHEFSAYWQWDARAVLATRDTTGHIYSYTRVELVNPDNVQSFSVYLPKNNLKAKLTWFSSVSNFVDNDSISSPENAIYIESHKLPFIKPGEAWPPTTFNQLLTWYHSVDHGSYNRLLKLIRENFQKNKLTIFFKFKDDHVVAVELKKSNLRAIALNQSIQRKSSNKILEGFLKSKRTFESFRRFSVEDASQEFILKRNAAASLVDKKIVLIGAGTIGGYLAHLLVQNGAGFGKGVLKIFDADLFSSGNIGRHILGAKYLLQRKSDAICHYIQSDYHCSYSNLESYGEFDHKKLNSFNSFDMIIDATGNRTFSTLLSHFWHKSDEKLRPRVLIHSWIDAAGQAARALIDDDHIACYHCIQSSRDLYPYMDDATQKGIRRSCAGSSYFEFSADASMTAASLGLNKALSYSIGAASPRFSHLSLSQDVKNIRSRDVAVLKGCPCCQT